jgi:hypothetical protein
MAFEYLSLATALAHFNRMPLYILQYIIVYTQWHPDGDATAIEII